MNCDCLNDCGDDPDLKTGKVQPCPNMAKHQERERVLAKQVATIFRLSQLYRAENLFDLIEKMHAQITAYKALL